MTHHKREFLRRLEALGACEEALAYASTKDTWEEAWNDCTRVYWIAWVVGCALAIRAYSDDGAEPITNGSADWPVGSHADAAEMCQRLRRLYPMPECPKRRNMN